MTRPDRDYEPDQGFLLSCPECKGEIPIRTGMVDVECRKCNWHGPWLACVMDMMMAAAEIATTRHDIALLRAENLRLTRENNKMKRITASQQSAKRMTRTSKGI